jgi:hypothetical protein
MTSRRQVIWSGLVGALSVSILLGKNSNAADIDLAAMSDFNAGRWRTAATQASRLADADNQAFAARCLLASALLAPSSRNRTADIAQARQFAEVALRLNARHIEGRLQLATALGLQARTGSPARAFAAGLPQRVKRILDGVVRDAPSEAWGHALLGGWHLEGLRIGGGAARTLLGVDLNAGKSAFARAIGLDPTIAATPFYYAASLLALAPTANAGDAKVLLGRSIACPNRDAFQAAVKARSSTMAQTLENDGPARAAQLALGWL